MPNVCGGLKTDKPDNNMDSKEYLKTTKNDSLGVYEQKYYAFDIEEAFKAGQRNPVASESNDIHNVSDRVFTFDQMMDVITEFSDNVNTNRFYTSGYELKAELIPHIKASISILDSNR